MSAGSVFVPAGNPSLLQPECFLLRCQASSYWWTGDRTGREGTSDTHRLGNHRMLCSNDLTSASSTAGEGAPSANTGDLTGRGRRKPNIPPAPRGAQVLSQPGPVWITVSSYMLPSSLPWQACLLSPLSFLPHDGFIFGVQACPSQGETTIVVTLVQENRFPYWNF